MPKYNLRLLNKSNVNYTLDAQIQPKSIKTNFNYLNLGSTMEPGADKPLIYGL